MNSNAPETRSSRSIARLLCGTALPLAAAVAIGAALTLSNGPAVGIAIGAALALLSLVIRKR